MSKNWMQNNVGTYYVILLFRRSLCQFIHTVCRNHQRTNMKQIENMGHIKHFLLDLLMFYYNMLWQRSLIKITLLVMIILLL